MLVQGGGGVVVYTLVTSVTYISQQKKENSKDHAEAIVEQAVQLGLCINGFCAILS